MAEEYKTPYQQMSEHFNNFRKALSGVAPYIDASKSDIDNHWRSNLEAMVPHLKNSLIQTQAALTAHNNRDHMSAVSHMTSALQHDQRASDIIHRTIPDSLLDLAWTDAAKAAKEHLDKYTTVAVTNSDS